MKTKSRSFMSILLLVSVLWAMPALAVENFGPGFRNGQSIGVDTEETSKETAEKSQNKAASSSEETKLKKGATPFGDVVTEESKEYSKGASLGEFKIVAYYGDGKTYSGTTPTANHTIAADLTVLPLGSKVFIGDTVYTVEDKGSAVVGQMIDIYYDTKEEAIGVTYYGSRSAEVFVAEKKA